MKKEWIYGSFDYNYLLKAKETSKIDNSEIGTFGFREHGFGPVGDSEKSGVENSFILNDIYFLMKEYVKNQLYNNFNKTYKGYMRFLRKCILPEIKQEMNLLDCEFVELDLYFENVLKRYQQVFMELLKNLKVNKNREVILVLISLELTAYNNYMEDKKIYEQIKNRKRENENVTYNFDTLDVLKDFIEQKLTLG